MAEKYHITWEWYKLSDWKSTKYVPPANEVCEGYVFTPVCQSFCSQEEGGVCLSACWDIHPLEQIPLMSRHPQSRHPLGSHPLGAYTPWADTPMQTRPLHSAYWEIRATSGRYASYWNAYLLCSYPSKESHISGYLLIKSGERWVLSRRPRLYLGCVSSNRKVCGQKRTRLVCETDSRLWLCTHTPHIGSPMLGVQRTRKVSPHTLLDWETLPRRLTIEVLVWTLKICLTIWYHNIHNISCKRIRIPADRSRTYCQRCSPSCRGVTWQMVRFLPSPSRNKMDKTVRQLERIRRGKELPSPCWVCKVRCKRPLRHKTTSRNLRREVRFQNKFHLERFVTWCIRFQLITGIHRF